MSNPIIFKGDQFVGYNVDPTTGDLVFRYVFAVADIPDANGRGVTKRVLENNKNIARGRPLIFAPNKNQGGSKGHTDFFKGDDPFKYEIGRIVNIDQASKNLFQRMRQNLIQTNSSYIELLKSEENLWIADVVITNEEMKKILLDPTTSHLIPRYVSPSFIHRRNQSGDYSRVDDAILDHIAIVKKPIFDPMSGVQIDGAAYGENTRLRAGCFGDKVACLNLLQTSSNKNIVELDKCVSCPKQLLDRLTELYKNLHINTIQIVQSSSDIMSSENQNQNNNNNQQQANTQTNVTSSTGQTPIPDQTSTTVSNPLSSFFKSDSDIQTNYGIFKNLITQVVKENPNEFRNVLMVDANATNAQQSNADSNRNDQPSTNADNLQSGETQQKEQQQQQQTDLNQQVTSTLEKLKITEEELKNMKVEDIKKKFGDVENIVKQVLQEQLRTSQTLQKIKEKEEKSKIANILPREAFTDERGFKAKEFDDLVGYLYKKGLDEQYIAILGVGLATLKNEQLKIKEQQINIKKGNLPQGFGESIRQKLGTQQQEQQQAPVITTQQQ